MCTGGRAATRLQQGYQFDHGLSFVAPAQEELKDVVKAQLDLEAQGMWCTSTQRQFENSESMDAVSMKQVS